MDGWEQRLFPIKEGDKFMLGPYRFECLGWENGRIKAKRYEWRGYVLGYVIHSLIPDLMLDPGFKFISRVKEVIDAGD